MRCDSAIKSRTRSGTRPKQSRVLYASLRKVLYSTEPRPILVGNRIVIHHFVHAHCGFSRVGSSESHQDAQQEVSEHDSDCTITHARCILCAVCARGHDRKPSLDEGQITRIGRLHGFHCWTHNATSTSTRPHSATAHLSLKPFQCPSLLFVPHAVESKRYHP